jgi:hypothetical protein
MKSKLYVLGDSFASNLFKKPFLKEDTEIFNFLEDFKNAHKTNVLWWTEYIEKWTNYEVVNLGHGGCTNEDIILQLGKVGKYNYGDRMIILWTHHARFKLYMDNVVLHANPHYIDNMKINNVNKEFLINMFETRDYTWHREDGEQFRNFLNYLYEINKDFNPIFTSIFPENILTMKNEPYFFNIAEMLRPECYINTESGGKYKDGHWGYAGNFRVALIMISKLFYGDEFTNEEKIKISKIYPKLGYSELAKLKIYEEYISKNIKTLI